eukprot:62859_1
MKRMLTQQPSTDQFMNKHTYHTEENDKIVSCTNPGCNQKMKRKHFKNHYNNKCRYTSQECQYCHQQNILRKDMSKHHSKNCYLNNGRFKFLKQLSKTLQGQIILALDLHNNNSKIIIKSANRYLVAKGLTTDGYNIPENFLTERHITMTLTQYNDCPIQNGLVKWISSWDDTNYYYYAMKYYPLSLFDYVQYHFQQKNKHYFPTNYTWMEIVQIIFTNLCKTIQWLHSKGYCHLDLSLENTMIDPMTFQVTIIDLGTAKYFENNNFECFGIIGKTHYMSPEVYYNKNNKIYYDARFADIYCIGSMLYTMLLGTRCYNGDVPSKNNLNNFVLLLEEYQHKLTDEISLYAIDLLQHIFRFESTRINLKNILLHSFINESEDNIMTNEVIYSDVLEMIMMNKQVDIISILREKGIECTDEFLQFVCDCIDIERGNIIMSKRMVYLYRMISELYVGGVIDDAKINLYFGHLMKAKYWKKCVNIKGFVDIYVKFICCLNDNDEMRLYNECMNVYYYEKKKK